MRTARERYRAVCVLFCVFSLAVILLPPAMKW